MNKRRLEKKIVHYTNAKSSEKQYLKLLNYTFIYEQKYGTVKTRKCMIKNLKDSLNIIDSIELYNIIHLCLIHLMIMLKQDTSTQSDEESSSNEECISFDCKDIKTLLDEIVEHISSLNADEINIPIKNEWPDGIVDAILDYYGERKSYIYNNTIVIKR